MKGLAPASLPAVPHEPPPAMGDGTTPKASAAPDAPASSG